MDRDPSTKERILSAAYSLFHREGFSRVSVDAIAERARLTKRTIYYHFASKDEIAAAALDQLHRHLMPQVQSWAGADPAGPAELVGNIFAALQSWADRDPWLGSGFSRIASELADRPGHPARRTAAIHKSSIEGWLADSLAASGAEDPEPLARQVMILIEGGMSLSLIHGDTGYIRSAGRAAEALLARAHQAGPRRDVRQ